MYVLNLILKISLRNCVAGKADLLQKTTAEHSAAASKHLIFYHTGMKSERTSGLPLPLTLDPRDVPPAPEGKPNDVGRGRRQICSEERAQFQACHADLAASGGGEPGAEPSASKRVELGDVDFPFVRSHVSREEAIPRTHACAGDLIRSRSADLHCRQRLTELHAPSTTRARLSHLAHVH